MIGEVEGEKQMRLLPLAVLQCALLLWLHFRTLRQNMSTLRAYVATHPPHHPSADVWLDGGPAGYSFTVCGPCVDALLA